MNYATRADLFNLLYPDSEWIYTAAVNGTLPRLLRLHGPRRCGQLEMARALSMLCSRQDVQVVAGASFGVRTDRVIESILAQPGSNLYIPILERTEGILLSVLDAFSDRIVFLSHAHDSAITGPVVYMRPLTFAEFRKLIKYMSEHKIVRWEEAKDVDEAIFDLTGGYQDAILDFVEATQKKWSKKEIIAITQNTSTKGASLYTVMTNPGESLDTVVTKFKEEVDDSVARVSWVDLARYIKRALRQDMLAGDSSFVMNGLHELLIVDIESSENHFIAGCLEIARVIRKQR